MVTPLASFVVLEPGRPVRLRARSARMETRDIRDPATERLKSADALVLDVYEVDGQPRETTLSLLSFKAQSALAPLINSGEAFRRELEITRRPRGFATEYEIRAL